MLDRLDDNIAFSPHAPTPAFLNEKTCPMPPEDLHPPPGAPAKNQPVKRESWFEVAKTIIYALIIAGVIRSLIFQPFNIPSGSMEATLLVGDYLFVSKSAYGYSRYSFPFGGIPFPGRVMGFSPTRGDVVVFKFPGDNSTDYIKRLIGLPGDRIQMKKSILYINGTAVPRVRVADYVGQPCPGPAQQMTPRYRETLPNGVSYDVLQCDPGNPLNDTPMFVVPQGHYFMMGDNRDNSDDSRENVGYVPSENFEGKAEIIFFATDESAHFWEFWKWPSAIRWNRIGQIIR